LLYCIYNNFIDSLKELSIGFFLFGFFISIHFLQSSLEKHISQNSSKKEERTGTIGPVFFGAISTLIILILLIISKIFIPCVK